MDRPDGPWWNGLSLVFTALLRPAPSSGGRASAAGSAASASSGAAGWRRVNWDLHSALGFWLFLFMLMWGVSGWVLGMPEPLTNFVERYSDPNGVRRAARRCRADVAVAPALRPLA